MSRKRNKISPACVLSAGLVEGWGQPTDEYFDPVKKMKLSRFGADKGPIERPMREVEVKVDGQKFIAHEVKDGLYRMKESGNISEDAYQALRRFQEEFQRCGYAHYASVNLNATGSGGMGIEEVFSRAQKSRNHVHYTIRLVGGPYNPMAAVLFWVIGLGLSFDKLTAQCGDSKHYWRGVFFAAARLMEDDYLRMCRGERRR